MRVHNPTCPPSFFWVLVAKIVTRTTNSGKKLMATKPLANPSGFVVDVCGLGLLASLAYRVESEVGIANLCILLVFTLALGGCIPQPAFTLEWGTAF